MQKLTILLLLCLAAIPLYSQQPVTLTGKVVDAKTDLPVPFANIQIKSASIGTASNEQGIFIFKFQKHANADTLVISSIGYKTEKRNLDVLTSDVTISLTPIAVQLAEVAVKAQTGLDIIKKALERIPDNYDTSSVNMTAFYRENLALADYPLAYNEAVLEIYKKFKKDKTLNDQIRIIKGRKKKYDFGSDGQFYYWMSGISNGARGALAEDIVKYYTADRIPLNPKNHKYYNFDYTGVLHEEDRNLIVIDINPKKINRKGLMKMRIFLDEESLAMVKINNELTESGVRYVSRKDKGLAYAIMSTITRAHTDYHQFKATTTYKRYNGKWYLNTVVRRWQILVNSRKRDMDDRLWHAELDFIVTDINTQHAKAITQGNIGNNEASMTTMIHNDNDEAFWENYNVLKTELNDSLKFDPVSTVPADTLPKKNDADLRKRYPNRQNGFTRADTLRGKLTPLRTSYDVTFYHLDVALNVETRSLTGSNLIRFTVEQPIKQMQIDLYENMNIDKIEHKDKILKFTREYNAVFIEFPEPLEKGTTQNIKVYYSGIPKTPDWSIPMDGGLLWDKDSLGNTWAQMVCQGSGASLWWPNKDHQSDEPDSMKIWITVPREFTEISNGRLIRTTPVAKNHLRYEWLVSYPINNYNVTFSIGKYVHFTDRYVSNDTLTIDYYVMPYNLDKAKRLFRQVNPMLACFEKNFGKYPFKRDGFTLVESLYPMEHQSGVCIGKINAQNSGATNPLMWHEAAHEWWGNAITSKDIADMWIHEAFATYAELQVAESFFGKELIENELIVQQQAAKNEEPVIGVYDVNHIHYDIGDMYSKGSLLIHMLRTLINDDTKWIQLQHGIQNQFRYKTLSSDQLVAFINQQTKTDFSYLFDQYLKYTKLPTLELEVKQKGQDIEIRFRWTADVQHFTMPLKVTTAVDTFDFIYPEPQWKSKTLKSMTVGDFEVDRDNFYIELSEKE